MRNESWLRMMSGLVLVGIFAAGALFGAGLMKWTARPADRLPPPHAGLPGGPPGRPPGGPIEAMRRELQLTDAQMTTLRAIADAHRPQLETITRATQQQVRDMLFQIEDELVPSLTPEQKRALDAWRARRPPLPPGPGMGGPPPGP